MLSLPALALLAAFIGPPILAYLVFGVLGRSQPLEKMGFKFLSRFDPKFIKFVQRAILWFLLFGISRFMYGWIHDTLLN
jgi:hypothetical protein